MTTYRSPLPPRTANTAEPAAAERLAATQQAMGMVPNMYGAMAIAIKTISNWSNHLFEIAEPTIQDFALPYRLSQPTTSTVDIASCPGTSQITS